MCPEWLPAQQKQRPEEPLLGHHVPPPRVWGLSIPAWPRPDPGELSLGTMVQRRHHQDSHQGWEVKPGRGWPGHCSEGSFLAESAFGGPELLEWHLSSSLPEQSHCFCCHLPSVAGCHRAAELTSISSGQDRVQTSPHPHCCMGAAAPNQEAGTLLAVNGGTPRSHGSTQQCSPPTVREAQGHGSTEEIGKVLVGDLELRQLDSQVIHPLTH